MRSAEGLLWIQIKNYKLTGFKLTSWCFILFFRKSSVLPLISGLQAAGAWFAATQRTCYTTLAVGTDLKTNPKVHGHSFADLCQHSRVRLSFRGISGWSGPLQSDKGTPQSPVLSKIQKQELLLFSFPPWLTPGCALQARSPLQDEQDNSNHSYTRRKYFLMATSN